MRHVFRTPLTVVCALVVVVLLPRSNRVLGWHGNTCLLYNSTGTRTSINSVLLQCCLTVWRSSVCPCIYPLAYSLWPIVYEAACDAASVHFGPTVRRTDILLCIQWSENIEIRMFPTISPGKIHKNLNENFRRFSWGNATSIPVTRRYFYCHGRPHIVLARAGGRIVAERGDSSGDYHEVNFIKKLWNDK